MPCRPRHPWLAFPNPQSPSTAIIQGPGNMVTAPLSLFNDQLMNPKTNTPYIHLQSNYCLRNTAL